MRSNEFVIETKRASAAVKLQRAWEREQAKSTASRQRADQAKAEFDKQWKEKKEKEQGVAEGGEKYKVKSIGRDAKGDYYISPSTGKKVYKSGVKRGDHENPKTGEHKRVAEAFGNRCPQCGMSNCTCAPGKCKCKPIDGWIPNKGFKKDVEEGNNYHANTTGFSKPKRNDDERHDLDVAQSTIYGLKINGQIWKKDGHVVTFATREKALAARNSIMLKRPELEVGLIQKGSAMESATGGATGSGSIASVAMPLGGKKKKKGAAVNLLGGPVFKR